MSVRGFLGDDLTPTELQVLEEFCKDGASNKVIAHRTGKKEGSIKSHLYAANVKLGSTNRSELLAKWTRRCQEDDLPFVEWLEDTLIPDLKDSGQEATAEDFEKCCSIIRRLYAC